MTTDSGNTILNLEDFLSIGHLVEPQFLSHLRTHLCGITVDSLTTSNDDINIADLLDGSSQGVGCCQRVGTGKQTIGEQPSGISSTIESLTDNFACAWRTHRKHANGAAGVLLLESQGLLQGI